MRVQLQDFAMEYRDVGGRKPVLFIHGYPLNSTLWEHQVHGLSFDRRVIVPDLRGHGKSEAVPGPYSMDTLARDCAQLLDRLGITERVVVGGLSMGGYVTFAFYRLFPERVEALILAATRPGPDSAEAQAKRKESAVIAREKGAAAIAEGMLPKILSPETYAAKPKLVNLVRSMMESTSVEGIAGALLGMKDRPDSTPTLAQIKVPTLILHGEDDQIIPPAEAKAMQAHIADSQLEIIPQAGHLLNLEQPELFNQAMRKFLNLRSENREEK